jgi:hypothetical protein
MRDTIVLTAAVATIALTGTCGSALWIGISFAPMQVSGRGVGASVTQRVHGSGFGSGAERERATEVGRRKRGAGSREQAAFKVPGSVHENAGDDRRVCDDGHDAHRGGTARAREGIDLVDAPQQLRAAVAARRDQCTGSVTATGPSTERPPAVSRRPSEARRARVPRVRLAYQP